MLLCDISSKRKIDKIPVKCDQCGNKFERELRGIIGQRKKRKNIDLCKKCSRLKENRYDEQPKKLKFKCTNCRGAFKRTYENFIRNKRKNGKVICTKCANIKASINRPQCQKNYWGNKEIKKKHGDSIRNSKLHQEAMKKVNLFGENNGMFGKKHSEETRKKMTNSRIGKVQSEKTINKRIETFKRKREEKLKNGEFNVNKELKHFVNSELKWTGRIIARDNCKCTKCGSTKKLDVHHIKSFNSIIKELLEGKNLKKSIDRYNFLKEQKEIRDENLENGITLCRKCHRKTHGYKWGSHNI